MIDFGVRGGGWGGGGGVFGAGRWSWKSNRAVKLCRFKEARSHAGVCWDAWGCGVPVQPHEALAVWRLLRLGSGGRQRRRRRLNFHVVRVATWRLFVIRQTNITDTLFYIYGYEINYKESETLIPTVFQQQPLCQAAVEGEPPAVVVHM